jgi:predicted nucleic acid-binding Zn ribbon protein
MKKCIVCGTDFKAVRVTKKYCSTECKDKFNNKGARKKARNNRYTDKKKENRDV